MQGAVLKNRQLDLGKSELSLRTAQLLRRGGLSDERFQGFVRELQRDYGRQPTTPWIVDTPEQLKARQAVREKLSEVPSASATPPAAAVETQDALRDAVRKRIQETKP